MRIVARMIVAFTLLLIRPQIVSLAQPTVPDVTGLTVPAAAAELNRAGYAIGAINALQDASQPLNTILSQSDASQSNTVDLTVNRQPVIAVIYDDNDLTLQNLTDQTIDIRNLEFVAEGAETVTYPATNWTDALRPNQCLQVWSIAVVAPKPVEGCEAIQLWRSTTDTAEHFWTMLNQVDTFTIRENGAQRAQCDAAPEGSQENPLRCDAYINTGEVTSDLAPFIYMVYTPDVFMVSNVTADQWMATDQTPIFNFNPENDAPGSRVLVGNTELLPQTLLPGDVTLLAPGQCILLVAGTNVDHTPQPCDVIARGDAGAADAFWLAEFDVQSVTDGRRRACPAATDDRLTLCILPR